MVETIVSTLFVGILMTTSLQTVGVSVRHQMRSTRDIVGAALASGLLSEIAAQSYMEPTALSSAIARESGESGLSRSTYDDVDDYNGWSETPPKTRNDVLLSEYAGWQRTVSVVWVLASNPLQVSGTETGVKKVTVTVSLSGTVMATRAAVRTNPS